jgi:cell wall-associated NlpC family hydrolase
MNITWKAVTFAALLAVPAFAAGPFTTAIAVNPARTIVSDNDGWAATFTDGARTVTVRGTARSFAEPSFTGTFTSSVWVRILPAPFAFFGPVQEAWLTAALADTTPDVLAISMQYVQGAALDASYGPINPATGARIEGSDFNDYLGIAWQYGTKTDQPDPAKINSLDCSGFMRMVWGYRSGMPLGQNPDGVTIPRRSFQILDLAPGMTIVPNNGTQITDFSKLQPGDIVFFDADPGDGTQIDHVGMYMGKDSQNHHRMISSRKTIDGPTFGTDVAGQGGKSILNGTGFYAKAFRAVRRF